MARLEVEIGATNAQLKSVLSDSQSAIKSFSSGVNNINLNIGGSSSRSITALNTSLKTTATLLKDIAANAASAKNNLAGMGGNVNNTTQNQQSISALNAAKAATQQYRAEVARLQAALAALRLANAQNKNNITAAAGSYREAQQQLTALGQAIRNAAGGFNSANPAIKAQIEQYRLLNEKIKEFDAQMGNHQRNVGNYSGVWDSFKTQLAGVVASYASLYAVIGGVSSIVKSNVEISDTLADVKRTAQLTGVEADNLVDALKAIPTRTGLNDLLEIAGTGGQLGIAKGELAGFVQALDLLGVALAKEIPGGADAVAEALGKINGVFKVAETQGLTAGQALEKTGSAILVLGQAGLATGGFLSDFTQRVGGAAQAAGISLPKILAYGAVLEEAGSSAEVAGTAINRLLGNLSTRTGAFFDVAKLADQNLTLKEFTRIINTDASQALTMFFAGLNSGNPTFTEFTNRLVDIKIQSGPARNAIIALAQNQEKLTERINESVKAYNDGSAAAEQARIRNLNLGGVIAQVGNQIKNSFVNSQVSQRIADFIAQISGIASSSDILLRKTSELNETYKEQNDKLDPLIKEYNTLSSTTNKTSDQSDRLKSIIQQIGEILPGAVTKWDAYGTAIEISSSKIQDLNDKFKSLIKDMNISYGKELNKEYDSTLKKINDISNAQKEINQPGRSLPYAQLPGDATVYDADQLREKRAQEEAKALEIVQKRLTAEQSITKEQKKRLDYYTQSNKKPITINVPETMMTIQNSSLNQDRKDALANELAQANYSKEAQIKIYNEINAAEQESEEGITKKQQSEIDKRIKAHEDYANKINDEQRSMTLSYLSGIQKDLKQAEFWYDDLLAAAKKNGGNMAEVAALYSKKIVQIYANSGVFTQKFNATNTAAASTVGSGLDTGIGKVVSKDLLNGKSVDATNLDTKTWAENMEKSMNQAARRFGDQFYDVISNLSQYAKSSFSAAFSDIVSKLNASFSEFFLSTLTTGLKSKMDSNFWESFNIGGLSNKVSAALVAGAGLAGTALAGAFSKTSTAGQGVAGALSGSASGLLAGAALGGKSGTLFGLPGMAVGAIAGGLIGAIGGIFGASSARKEQEELEKQQLEEAKKQTELLREQALAYSSSIIGQMTNQGIVNSVDRNAFGDVVFRIDGKDLVATYNRNTNSR